MDYQNQDLHLKEGIYERYEGYLYVGRTTIYFITNVEIPYNEGCKGRFEEETGKRFSSLPNAKSVIALCPVSSRSYVDENVKLKTTKTAIKVGDYVKIISLDASRADGISVHDDMVTMASGSGWHGKMFKVQEVTRGGLRCLIGNYFFHPNDLLVVKSPENEGISSTVIKEGDRVLIKGLEHTKRPYGVNNEMTRMVGSTYRVDCVNGDRCYINGHTFSHYDLEKVELGESKPLMWFDIPDQLNKKISTKERIQHTMKNLLTKIREAFKTEPEKSLFKAGVINDCGRLTEEGKEAFTQWLFDNNKTEFNTQVIQPMLEAEEASK